MAEVYLGLGSNIGDREKYIADVLILFHNDADIRLITGSSLYETEPVGYTEQDCFLNIVIKIRTHMSPHNLLNRLKDIENTLGKHIKKKWGPRTIDIDILYYGNEIIQDEELTIPHPLINNRRFVLVGLAEIAGGFICPKTLVSIDEIMKSCNKTGSVVKVKNWGKLMPTLE